MGLMKCDFVSSRLKQPTRPTTPIVSSRQWAGEDIKRNLNTRTGGTDASKSPPKFTCEDRVFEILRVEQLHVLSLLAEDAETQGCGLNKASAALKGRLALLQSTGYLGVSETWQIQTRASESRSWTNERADTLHGFGGKCLETIGARVAGKIMGSHSTDQIRYPDAAGFWQVARRVEKGWAKIQSHHAGGAEASGDN